MNSTGATKKIDIDIEKTLGVLPGNLENWEGCVFFRQQMIPERNLGRQIDTNNSRISLKKERFRKSRVIQ